MSLKPYNEDAACIKCGHREVSSTYHEAHITHRWNMCCLVKELIEHIVRRCENCRYEWVEAPLNLNPESCRHCNQPLVLATKDFPGHSMSSVAVCVNCLREQNDHLP